MDITAPCQVALGQFSDEFLVSIDDVDGSKPATVVPRGLVRVSATPAPGEVLRGRVVVEVVKVEDPNALIRLQGGMFDRTGVTVPKAVLKRS